MKIPLDPDGPEYTYFISLQTPTNDLKVFSNDDEFQVHLINSGQISGPFSNARLQNVQECGEPLAYIPQSEWRQGLPDPSYDRSFHEVNHNIVHHSAGSNSNTNYTQVVRDIYILHTEVNGWSDIGYNYLVAQDGTLYAGRDPDGGSQDLVRGAHFCGRNTGTLGICLLGNYEEVEPTQESWTTLQNFMVYSLINLNLDPFDEISHPTGLLGTIAGHRDGCATLCPGENVYTRIESLKAEVASQIELCIEEQLLVFEFDSTVAVGQPIVFTNLSQGYESYEWIFEGGTPSSSTNYDGITTYLTPGTYDITLVGYQGEEVDTLSYPQSITASRFSNTPAVLPNPISRFDRLKIDFVHDVETVRIFDSSGKFVDYKEQDEFSVNYVPGIYFLYLTTSDGPYFRRLIVR